jgi:hypothetical protein
MRPELLSELRSGDAQWILRAGRLLAEDGERSAGLLKTSAYQQLCDVAHEQLSELANIAPDKLREQLEQLLLLDGVPVGLQWLYDSGALSQLLPELHATGELLARSWPSSQRCLGAHQAGGVAGAASTDGALVGAAPRHRQGQDAGLYPRWQGHVSPSQRGRRADVR